MRTHARRRPARVATLAAALIALVGLLIGAAARADAATITATIGCNSAGQVVYKMNASGLPKSTTVNIKIERWGSGSSHQIANRSQLTDSRGSLSTPTFYGADLSTSDFGTEWVQFSIFQGANLLGSGSASTPTCGGPGGTWTPPAPAPAIPAAANA